jgi:hypothetical protein
VINLFRDHNKRVKKFCANRANRKGNFRAAERAQFARKITPLARLCAMASRADARDRNVSSRKLDSVRSIENLFADEKYFDRRAQPQGKRCDSRKETR